MKRKISIPIVIVILAVFFWPKDCGKWAMGPIFQDVIFTEECSCIGFKHHPFRLGGGPIYCFGIPISTHCYEFSDREEIEVSCEQIWEEEVREEKWIGTEEVKDETTDWQTYSNLEANFIFKYPKDWKIIEDYFYKSTEGTKTGNRIITLQKDRNEDSNDWIRINPIQFQSLFGKCTEVYGNSFCTYSKDSVVLNILNQISSTFKFSE